MHSGQTCMLKISTNDYWTQPIVAFTLYWISFLLVERSGTEAQPLGVGVNDSCNISIYATDTHR